MADFKSGENPFAQQSQDIPAGVDPFAAAPVKQPETKWYDDLNAGIASGATRIARGVLKPFVPEADWQQMEQQGGALSQQSLKALQGMSDTPLGKVGDVGMDVVSTAALPFGAASKVPALAKAMQARGFLPGAARTADAAATQAGIGAALSPDDRLGGAAFGAAGGVVGQGLGKVMGGVVRPTNEARTLMDAGVALTPGQAAGAGSLTKRTEEYLGTLPVASHFIRSAQNRATVDLNRAVVNQSIEQITGHPVPKNLSAREAYYHASDLVSKQYDNALPYIAATPKAVMDDVSTTLTEATRTTNLVPQAEWEKANSYILGRIGDAEQTLPRGEALSGVFLKQIDSEIGAHVRGLAKSQDPLQRASAEAWFTVQDGLRSAMAKGATGNAGEKLRQADQAYKQLVPIRKALGNNDAATPRALRKAMESTAHPSRALVEASNNVLPNQVPSSGTAERLLVAGLPSLLLGGGYGAQQFGLDTLGTGMMAAGALGSRPGAKFMTGGYGLQEAIANALRRTTPAALRGANKDE